MYTRSFTVLLPMKTHEGLKNLSAERMDSMSRAAIKAINEYLEKEAKKKAKKEAKKEAEKEVG
ncbi:MAG: hypothetical protein MRJ65_15530 [Candidatus Brocadiaceae bacterium]|nr:hypothetical protein [Candidatus Brocadiaceae bacterium]